MTVVASWLVDLLRGYLQDPFGAFTSLAAAVGAFLLAAARVTAAPAVAAGLVWVVGMSQLRRRQAARLVHGARWVEVLPPPQVDPAGAGQLWDALHDALRPRRWAWLTGPLHVAWELQWSDGGAVRFGLWVPGPVPPGLVERAVEGAWPGARTRTVEPPPALIPAGSAAGGHLRLGQPDRYPLRTDHAVDPLRQLLAAAADPQLGETAAVQVLLRPRPAGWSRRLLHQAWLVRTGQPTTATGRLLDLLAPGPVIDSRAMQRPAVSVDVRAITAKADGIPLWVGVVRYAVAEPPASGDPKVARRRARARLRGRAHALASAFGVHQGRNHLRRHRLADPTAALAGRRFRRGDLLSAGEVVALAHLPADAVVPGVTRAGARATAPRPDVPIAGRILGDADAGAARPVAMRVADGRHHLHVLGATGSGKSTLLARLLEQDVAASRGAVLVDPKGDLVNDLLERLPAAVADRLVLLDPTDTAAPPTLNMLEGPDPATAVDHVVAVFRHIFTTSWGPRADDILRAACLTLLRTTPGGATLAEIPPLLTDPLAGERAAARLPRDDVLVGFWRWYAGLGDAGRAAAVGPVLARLRQVLTRPYMAAVMGSATSSFDMAAVLDGGVLLARVPKGVLGPESSRLLGSFIVSRAWQAALRRAGRPEHTRRDASLYVDECHNFLALPSGFDELFAEARAYRLSLVLAHQHLAQLPSELREAMSANARSKLLFTTSPEDARALARHTLPALGEHDLAHLGRYQAAGRLIVDGQETPAMTLRTRPPSTPAPDRATLLRAASRRRYGRPAAQRAAHRLARTHPAPGRGTFRTWAAGGAAGGPVGKGETAGLPAREWPHDSPPEPGHGSP